MPPRSRGCIINIELNQGLLEAKCKNNNDRLDHKEPNVRYFNLTDRIKSTIIYSYQLAIRNLSISLFLLYSFDTVYMMDFEKENFNSKNVNILQITPFSLEEMCWRWRLPLWCFTNCFPRTSNDHYYIKFTTQYKENFIPFWTYLCLRLIK